MLRSSRVRHAFVNKSVAIGSKGQKHQHFVPTLFLYRIPGRTGAGPTVMKYMHTLGCFPSGLDTPIRLEEFKRTYLSQHVPLEVEEWLGCFLQSPVDAITQNVQAALQAVDMLAIAPPTLHARAIPVDGLLNAVTPVKQALAEVGLDVPAAAIRFTLQRPTLRKKLCLALNDWADTVAVHGSTPHRRMAARQALIDAGVAPGADANEVPPALGADISAPSLSSPLATSDATHVAASTADASMVANDGKEGAKGEDLAGVYPFSPQGIEAVAAAVSPSPVTADDERYLLEAMTLIAEGAQRQGRYDLAEQLLRDGLRLSHDDETEAVCRANYACALTGCGRFSDAEAEAREAVLLQRRPKAFAAWAVAVAYQDDPERASAILEDGLSLYPDNEELLATSASLQRHMVGRETVPEEGRNRRVHMAAQYAAGTVHGSGRVVNSGFDVTTFRGKQVRDKVNVSSGAGLGQEVRRIGSPNWSPLSHSQEHGY